MDVFEQSEATANMRTKFAAALAYAAASSLIMMINKIVLTGYGFPSFLFVACLQYATSIVVLIVQRQQGTVKPFPLFSVDAIREVFPVPLIFLGNTISGLGATKMLNMPLFVLLRRFSIVMTMILEVYLLGKRFTMPVKASVGVMILGAVIAASADLSFEMSGMAMILMNNFATALQGVGLRKKMDQLSSTNLGTPGIMYYNNLVSFPFILLFMVGRPHELSRLAAFPHWGRIDFLLALMGSAVMGFVLNYSYYWCTKANSPTTTTVVGAFKNILTSYGGMLFSDYVYSVGSFIGINISVAGSLWYNWEELKKVRRSDAERQMKERDNLMESAASYPSANMNNGVISGGLATLQPNSHQQHRVVGGMGGGDHGAPPAAVLEGTALNGGKTLTSHTMSSVNGNTLSLRSGGGGGVSLGTTALHRTNSAAPPPLPHALSSAALPHTPPVAMRILPPPPVLLPPAPQLPSAANASGGGGSHSNIAAVSESPPPHPSNMLTYHNPQHRQGAREIISKRFIPMTPTTANSSSNAAAAASGGGCDGSSPSSAFDSALCGGGLRTRSFGGGSFGGGDDGDDGGDSNGEDGDAASMARMAASAAATHYHHQQQLQQFGGFAGSFGASGSTSSQHLLPLATSAAAVGSGATTVAATNGALPPLPLPPIHRKTNSTSYYI